MVTEVGLGLEVAVSRERSHTKAEESGLVVGSCRGSEGMAARSPFPGKNGARPG